MKMSSFVVFCLFFILKVVLSTDIAIRDQFFYCKQTDELLELSNSLSVQNLIADQYNFIKNNEIIYLSNDLKIYKTLCTIIEEVNIVESEQCILHLPVKFSLKNKLEYGFLYRNGIVRPDTTEDICNKTKTFFTFNNFKILISNNILFIESKNMQIISSPSRVGEYLIK